MSTIFTLLSVNNFYNNHANPIITKKATQQNHIIFPINRTNALISPQNNLNSSKIK